MLATSLARFSKRLVLNQLSSLDQVHGRLLVIDEDGTKHIFGGGMKDSLYVEVTILAASAWMKILSANDIGFAEAYMLNLLTCSNLTDFFRILIPNTSTSASSGPRLISILTSAVTGPLYRLSNTAEQAILNAQSHYSLSNEIFSAFLDPTLTYSAPLWLPLGAGGGEKEDTLEAAQLRKLHHTIVAAHIKTSDHVLEIGTGWGSFALEAVRSTGCRVTTITASSEQAYLARERIKAAGFEERIEVLVCDYRDVPPANVGDETGGYDKIVSIEMIEHVGEAYLDTYFTCIDRYLKGDGGIAVFQVITIPEVRYEGYKRRSDFIQRYIFPGGHLPTVSGLVASIDRGSKGKLIVDNIKSLGGNYVRTLREWRENFLGAWEQIIKPALLKVRPLLSKEDLEVFRRKWEYYFCYCEAGFNTKTLSDVSITVARAGAIELV